MLKQEEFEGLTLKERSAYYFGTRTTDHTYYFGLLIILILCLFHTIHSHPDWLFEIRTGVILGILTIILHFLDVAVTFISMKKLDVRFRGILKVRDQLKQEEVVLK